MKALVSLLLAIVLVLVSSPAFAGQSLSDLRAAAQRGDAKAQNALGLMYYYGDDIAKDEAQALEWFHKAAARGNALAQYNLGVLHAIGEGVAKDQTQAMEWFIKAADQKDTEARNRLVWMAEKGFAPAMEWLRTAATRGDADAQRRFGLMYCKGRGVTQDAKQAAQWLRKAAKQGDVTAQISLGRMFATDVHGLDAFALCVESGGVATDATQAAAWFRMAAKQGRAFGQYALGVLYANGRGVAKDLSQAAGWFLKAEETTRRYDGRGSDIAQGMLAELAEKGVPAAAAWSRTKWQEANDASFTTITEKNCPYKKLGSPKTQKGFFRSYGEGHGDGIPVVEFAPDNGRIIQCMENTEHGQPLGGKDITLSANLDMKHGMVFSLKGCTRVSVTYQATQFLHDWPDKRTCEHMPELLSITVLKPMGKAH